MKLGFLLSHMGDQEFIKSANEFLLNHGNGSVDIIAFVSNQIRPKQRPSFASMNINEAFDFNGCVIATDLYMAEKAAHFPGPKRIYYYQIRPEWCEDKVRSFEEHLEIYNNPRLSIIARTSEDAKLFKDCWNRPVRAIIPDWNMEAFVGMVRMDDTK